MSKIVIACLTATTLALGGCAYNAPVSVSPNLNVYSSYGEKIPGRFALVVNSEAFSTTVRPTGLACSAHSFPLDLRQAFTASATATIRQLVDDVQVLERPVSLHDLARQGFTGQVIINADTLNARVQIAEGFFRSTADSVIEMSAGMTVDTAGGRVLGTSAQGFGNAQNDAGAMCGQTATAIGVATEKAMRQLLGQMGERLSNSERLRQASASVLPGSPQSVLAPSAPAYVAPSQPAAMPVAVRGVPAAPQPACGMVAQANGSGVRYVPCK